MTALCEQPEKIVEEPSRSEQGPQVIQCVQGAQSHLHTGRGANQAHSAP